MNKALIIVDYQYDFVADDGALTVGKPAQEIERRIAELADGYEEEDIYFTFDAHNEQDWETYAFPETKAFGKHCVKGTKGYELWGDIKGMKNKGNHIDKHAYCPSGDVVGKLITKYEHITVVGVVTDICVFQTVIGLYTEAVNRAKKLSLTVDSSACASFNTERENWALKYMSEILSVEVL